MCRKLIYGMLAAAALFATSCIYDGLDTAAPEDLSEVTFNLDLEGAIATRAISDGKSVNQLFYSIYKVEEDENGNEVATLQKFVGSDEHGRGGKNDFVSGATVTVSLAKEQTYRAVFWAQDAACSAYNTEDLTNVQISYASAANNDENRDAFCAVTEFVAGAGVTCDVVLRRPFAQVNVGVIQSDWDQAVASGVTVKESSVVIKNAATSLNLLTGAVGPETEDVEVSYSAAAIPAEVLKVETDDTQDGKESYVWLSMSYILVPDHNDVVGTNGMLGDESATLASAEFTFVPENGTNIVLNEGLTNIPVQRNWRTNILGTILAGNVDFNITIDPAYYNDSNLIQIADGVVADEEKGTFYVANAKGIEWLSENLTARDGFAGKTVKLTEDIDLYELDENGEPKCFDPIGSYRFDESFKGVLDGQNHTIKNMNQNTWALNNGYYYNDCGMGLFGALEEATIKNLIIDEASISGESALCGIVAAVAHNSTFENITVTNSQCADYQYYAGGIVGWVSGDNNNFIQCNVDASTVVGGQWGDFANSNGGVIGGASSTAKIYMKDCNVACQIDAVNDVVSSYQYYAYRCCGMLIGNTNNTQVIDGTTYAAAPQLTCENVTVTYGDWMNYHYCEFAGTGYPYVRVEPGVSVEAYVNIRYGHPTDANGNTVVDDNHVHNDGEDHHLCLPFDQLLGGGPNGNGRNPVYGLASFDGVTVIYPESYVSE